MNKNINCEQENIKLLEENGFHVVLGRNETEIFEIIDDVCKIDRKIKFAGILSITWRLRIGFLRENLTITDCFLVDI